MKTIVSVSSSPASQSSWKRFAAFFLIVASFLCAGVSQGAQANSYTRTNLVSDVPGLANFTDPNLVNPWGLTLGNEFWVSDNATGVSTLYQLDGTPLSLVVTIPPAAGNTEGISAPTGQVFNPGSGFTVTKGSKTGAAMFIFVSEDGAISGWNPSVDPTNAIIAVDHSANHAIYKGSAISDSLDRLYVTDFHNAKVEIYDQNFNEIDTASTFVDPRLPGNYAPFGIQSINGLIYVTYAQQDADKVDDVPGAGRGFVSVFDTNGNFLKRLITRGALNAPWGLALAPDGFGKVSGKLLVGNFGNGQINAYDSNSGRPFGPMRNSNGAPLTVNGLWGMLFVDTDLYVTAGPEDESHGIFAEITADSP